MSITNNPEMFSFKRSQLNPENPDGFNRSMFFNELDTMNRDYLLKQISNKKRKRAENMKLFEDMIENLLDLVDECYNYQVKENTDTIELPKWKEWMESFINNKPIGEFNYFIKEKKEEENLSKKDPLLNELNRFGANNEELNTQYDKYSNDAIANRLITVDESEVYDYEFYAGKCALS